MSTPDYKRRSAAAKARKEAGVMRALELLQRDDLAPVERPEIIAREFKVASRTAYNWLKEASELQIAQQMQIPEPAHHGLYTIEDANRNPHDVNGHRWRRVQQYLKDIDEWRTIRDGYMSEHRSCSEKKRPESLRQLKNSDERLLAWEKQLCEILHFGIVSPDRGLSDARVRGLIVTELARNISVLTPQECALLQAAIEALNAPDQAADTDLDEVLPH